LLHSCFGIPQLPAVFSWSLPPDESSLIDKSNVPWRQRFPLHQAVRDQNINEIKSFIDSGTDVNALFSLTPPGEALKLGNETIVKILLNARANLKGIGSRKLRFSVDTPALEDAVVSGKLSLIKLILEHFMSKPTMKTLTDEQQPWLASTSLLLGFISTQKVSLKGLGIGIGLPNNLEDAA
jgi:hypothetical protein